MLNVFVIYLLLIELKCMRSLNFYSNLYATIFKCLFFCLLLNIGTSNSETHSHVEQDRYINAIISCTPSPSSLGNSSVWGLSDSSLSINSLLLAAEDNTLSPETLRRTNGYNNNKGSNTISYAR